jgi:hypothetical protein
VCRGYGKVDLILLVFFFGAGDKPKALEPIKVME